MIWIIIIAIVIFLGIGASETQKQKSQPETQHKSPGVGKLYINPISTETLTEEEHQRWASNKNPVEATIRFPLQISKKLRKFLETLHEGDIVAITHHEWEEEDRYFYAIAAETLDGLSIGTLNKDDRYDVVNRYEFIKRGSISYISIEDKPIVKILIEFC